ncbi:UDP-glucose dehydrogenase family protein [Metabacillus halosaccharovorans]|uniref:UDP-glucose dehydrogenase family protein n=1 Tax=Metabacillus halosaccharovorans TaxID=930124 RepID=UPI001C1F8778|nr:UDP-glucose/GDP-mannose dehydrogenase family protein [Metabacillus halosaccharovorans]MBU7594540.1 UDP-glucose/GDP-mannose dehydrogenase family protein [Metabacillus halosaccharovorans]
MKVTVVGVGYVGLVTGTCLADVGHQITCMDVDRAKIENLKLGFIPIYEPFLEDLVKKNLIRQNLMFTNDKHLAYKGTDIIIIAVGTPEQEDGTANLSYIRSVAEDIANNIDSDVIVVTKSTVPVGTNYKIKKWIEEKIIEDIKVDVVSNPEFLREGSAIKDTFEGERIIIGSDTEVAGKHVEELYHPFNIPIVKTDIKSAEMIKYASNAFLATKISFINEIANICEKVGANIEDVADGIGRDKRIGKEFLGAGIGYGGSCFPKDTKALVQIAGNVQHDFELLEAVIRVNNSQQRKLINIAKEVFGSLKGKNVALLGLSFKPNTDDVRESASILMANQLVLEGARVTAYDPVAFANAEQILGNRIIYSFSIEEAIKEVDLCIIGTDWKEIREFSLLKYKSLMKTPFIFDGRNCYSLEEAEKAGVNYFSIGRNPVIMKDTNDKHRI